MSMHYPGKEDPLPKLRHFTDGPRGRPRRYPNDAQIVQTRLDPDVVDIIDARAAELQVSRTWVLRRCVTAIARDTALLERITTIGD